MKHYRLSGVLLTMLLIFQTPISAMQPTENPGCTYCNLAGASILIGAGIMGVAYYRHHMHCTREKELQQEAREYCLQQLEDAKRISKAWEKIATKNPETHPVQIRTLQRIRRLFSPFSITRTLALEKKYKHLERYIERLAAACPADGLYSENISWFVIKRSTGKKIPSTKSITRVLDLYDRLIEIINKTGQ